MTFSRHPTAEDVRLWELAHLPQLVAEQRQAEVAPWTRWQQFLDDVDRVAVVIEQRAHRRRKAVA